MNARRPDAPVDVLINVFGKPYQTGLALLSLLRFSDLHIDRIYFHEEPANSEFERKNHVPLLDYLGERVVYYKAPLWLGTETTDEALLASSDEYRLSMRYQYGWEQTGKKFALIIHNDIEITGDILGDFLGQIGEATAIGEIGQCWWCPAGQGGLCCSEKYTEFRPKYHQLMYIYNENMDYAKRRAYNLGLRREFWEEPWPLPECRMNEWCMLVNMEKARPDTQPFGSAAPIGAVFASGARIGEQWDEDVNLDTGVWWFRNLNHLGHCFKDYPVERHVLHDRRGNVALHQPELYVRNEIAARKKLEREYPDFPLAAYK